MAKKMDMTKLDRIREASVEIISEHGILNSSVASIAERAGVSVGYLYRHYPGKVDLINDLLEDALRTITDRIYALADETNDIRKIVRGIVEFIIESAATNRPKHKFLIMLLNDFSVEINPDIRERIRSIGDTLIAVGRKNNGEFYQFNLSSCIRQQNSLTAQFVSFSLSNLANIFSPPPNFYNN